MTRHIPIFFLLCLFSCQTRQWNLNEAIAETHKVREVIETSKTNILFVQWQPTSPIDTSHYIDVIFKRQSIEEQIGKKLKRNSIGRWVAGDLSASGANMLFEVNNFEKSLKIALEVLESNGIKGATVVARRDLDSDGNWTYRVVFPISNLGKFNDL